MADPGRSPHGGWRFARPVCRDRAAESGMRSTDDRAAPEKEMDGCDRSRES